MKTNGLFHIICVATVEKKIIKEVCPRLRLNIQICQSIAGCHQVIHQENDRSLVDKSECVPQMRVIIV